MYKKPLLRGIAVMRCGFHRGISITWIPLSPLHSLLQTSPIVLSPGREARWIYWMNWISLSYLFKRYTANDCINEYLPATKERHYYTFRLLFFLNLFNLSVISWSEWVWQILIVNLSVDLWLWRGLKNTYKRCSRLLLL